MPSVLKPGLVVIGLFFAAPAFAQPAKDAPPVDRSADKPAPPAATNNAGGNANAKPAATGNSGNIRVERTDSGQKLFRITEGLVVEGQRQKPNAFYVLQRASAPYDWEALEENFLPRIIKAAEKPPF